MNTSLLHTGYMRVFAREILAKLDLLVFVQLGAGAQLDQQISVYVPL